MILSRNTAYRAAIIAATVLVLIIMITAADRMLSGLGSPLQVHLHPPNFSEERVNLEFAYEFRTNSQGIRYRDIPLENPLGTEYRILVAGDSFVEGSGVNFDATEKSDPGISFGATQHQRRSSLSS